MGTTKQGSVPPFFTDQIDFLNLGPRVFIDYVTESMFAVVLWFAASLCQPGVCVLDNTTPPTPWTQTLMP